MGKIDGIARGAEQNQKKCGTPPDGHRGVHLGVSQHGHLPTPTEHRLLAARLSGEGSYSHALSAKLTV